MEKRRNAISRGHLRCKKWRINLKSKARACISFITAEFRGFRVFTPLPNLKHGLTNLWGRFFVVFRRLVLVKSVKRKIQVVLFYLLIYKYKSPKLFVKSPPGFVRFVVDHEDQNNVVDSRLVAFGLKRPTITVPSTTRAYMGDVLRMSYTLTSISAKASIHYYSCIFLLIRTLKIY